MSSSGRRATCATVVQLAHTRHRDTSVCYHRYHSTTIVSKTGSQSSEPTSSVSAWWVPGRGPTILSLITS